MDATVASGREIHEEITATASKSLIRAFFDESTNTISYLVADPSTGEAADLPGPSDHGWLETPGFLQVLLAERVVQRARTRRPTPRAPLSHRS